MTENASMDKVEEQLEMIPDINFRPLHAYAPSHTGAHTHAKTCMHTHVYHTDMKREKGIS